MPSGAVGHGQKMGIRFTSEAEFAADGRPDRRARWLAKGAARAALHDQPRNAVCVVIRMHQEKPQ